MKFQITPELANVIRQSSAPETEKKRLLEKESFTRSEIQDFYLQCHPTQSLLDLLRTTKLVIPNLNEKNEDRVKTKEFLDSMETLRLRAKELEYQKLLNPKLDVNFFQPDDTFDPKRALREVRSHITTIFNILLSVLSVSYGIWYWTDTSWRIRDSYRVLLCLFFGGLVLVAEIVMYIGYLRRLDEARDRERNKKEIRRVVRSIRI